MTPFENRQLMMGNRRCRNSVQGQSGGGCPCTVTAYSQAVTEDRRYRSFSKFKDKAASITNLGVGS